MGRGNGRVNNGYKPVKSVPRNISQDPLVCRNRCERPVSMSSTVECRIPSRSVSHSWPTMILEFDSQSSDSISTAYSFPGRTWLRQGRNTVGLHVNDPPPPNPATFGISSGSIFHPKYARSGFINGIDSCLNIRACHFRTLLTPCCICGH